MGDRKARVSLLLSPLGATTPGRKWNASHIFCDIGAYQHHGAGISMAPPAHLASPLFSLLLLYTSPRVQHPCTSERQLELTATCPCILRGGSTMRTVAQRWPKFTPLAANMGDNTGETLGTTVWAATRPCDKARQRRRRRQQRLSMEARATQQRSNTNNS